LIIAVQTVVVNTMESLRNWEQSDWRSSIQNPVTNRSQDASQTYFKSYTTEKSTTNTPYVDVSRQNAMRFQAHVTLTSYLTYSSSSIVGQWSFFMGCLPSQFGMRRSEGYC